MILSPEAENQKLREELNKLRSQVADANRAKDEYLQNVAHQLAAPINAIKMNIEALDNPRVMFDRKKILLRSLYSQGTILAHLIKNFSLMAHLEADHTLTGFQEKPEKINPFRLCVNYTNDFQPIGKHKNQQIFVDEVSYDKAGKPQIFSIKNLFAQVIYNLLENATKYADDDSKIVIGFRPDQRDAIIAITSTGLPINPTDLPKLFTRGARGAAAKPLHPAGTGFGLYIARRIMEIHRGGLTVELNGNTSTFLVRCPKAP